MDDSAMLDAAAAGELDALQSQLQKLNLASAQVEEEVFESPPEITRILCAAARAGHATIVRWLIYVRCPEWRPHVQSHMAAISGGPPVYAVFLSKWPELIDMDLGHNGNPLGLAILGKDKPMVEFLLRRGVDPNIAQCGGRLLRKSPTFMRECPDDIMTLLVAHGITVPAAAIHAALES